MQDALLPVARPSSEEILAHERVVRICRYVMEAIKTSGLVTYDIEQADVVFVDSYCYHMWWLGWTHSRGRTQEGSPGVYLIAALEGTPS